MSLVLNVDGLVVARGERIILDGVNLRVEAGSAVIVEGPNGAGKTTLLRSIAGYLPVLSGQIRVEGDGGEAELQEQLHYIGHQNAVKNSLTVGENVAFWADFLGGTRAGVADALVQLQLQDLEPIPAFYLSAGQTRRVALSRLISVPRPIWLLDEPTVALDAASRDKLTEIGNAHLAGGGIIVAATHMPLPFDGARVMRLGELGEVAA